jgi:threonine/homoserine/homoserine lactone efflux protein
MIPPDVIFLFVAASVALAMAPGPDNIYVLTQSARNGPVAGLFVTLGLCTGVIVHTTLVALGVAVIFESSRLAFTLLKLVGACYLLYLAWKAFRAGAMTIEAQEKVRMSNAALYGSGVVMNIANPKVAIFFLAFLPQFADPARGSVTLQIFMFGALFILCAFVVFGMVAWAAGIVGHWLANAPGAQVALNRVSGVIFAGLAVRLLLARQ